MCGRCSLTDDQRGLMDRFAKEQLYSTNNVLTGSVNRGKAASIALRASHRCWKASRSLSVSPMLDNAKAGLRVLGV